RFFVCPAFPRPLHSSARAAPHPEYRAMASDATAAPAQPGLRLRLSIMMFLQFFIWGAWYPLVFAYLPSLGYTEGQTFIILSMFHLSALVAVFFSNQFADRNFAAEKFLAFSQLVGGAAILGLAFIQRPGPVSAGTVTEHPAAPFWPFFVLMAIHTLF